MDYLHIRFLMEEGIRIKTWRYASICVRGCEAILISNKLATSRIPQIKWDVRRVSGSPERFHPKTTTDQFVTL